MKKIIFTHGFIMLMCIICLTSCSQFSGIPEEIKRYVFEKSQFAQPLTLKYLPPGDHPNQKEEIVRQWKQSQNAMLLPPIFYGGKEVNIDKNILNFLIKNNYAKTDKMTLTVRNEPTNFSFLYYTRELEPYIQRRSGQSGFEIILAQRKLKSIGHTNSYTANIYGANVKVWAFTFVYTLENKLPGLPKVMKEFEGKAKAHLDPDDGKWKVEGVSLSDRGDAEYLDMLTQKLMVDSQRMQKSLKVSNLSYQYGSGSISFIFNLEGGVPPYKYNWPTINGVPINNLLYPYRAARGGYNAPLYRINFQDVKDGSGAITIAMEDEFMGFGWPPDITFPLKIILRLADASSPPKVATLETTVPSGQRLSPEWRNEILGFDNWIEKDGKRMSSGKGR